MANTWVIHYEIAAKVIILTIIILFTAGERIHTVESEIFFKILLVGLASAIFSELSVLGLSGKINISMAGNYILAIIYNISLLGLIYLYAVYIISLTKAYVIHVKSKMKLLSLPLIIETILLVTTPFSKLIFYIDKNGIYHRGIGMPIYLLGFCVYVTYIGYMCIARSRFLNRQQIFSIIFYTSISVICIALQFVFPKILLDSFAISIGLLVIYFSMQGEFVDTDRMLGTFSTEALGKKVQIGIDSGKKFNIITIRIGGFDELNVIHGYEAANDIMRQVAEYLMRLIPEHMVFHVNGYFFSCYVEGDDSVAFDYAARIQERFLQRFRTESMKNDANILFKISVVSVPRIADNYEKITAINNIVLEEFATTQNQYITVVDENIIKEYDRRCRIELAIERAVRSGEFSVCYQPIINLETKQVDGAEALIRLTDDELGEIEPMDFLPIAEKNGSIVQLTSMVVHRVCRFVLDNKIEKYGIKYIGINLSAAECQQHGMADRLLAIVKGYDLPYNMIRFEIKESTHRDGMYWVKENMDKLVDGGLQLVLDSFGLGYSNAAELVDLPIEMIKVDKDLLWLAEEDKDAMTVLRALVGMMRSLGRTVLISGVEEEVHEEIINELDIQFAQGYYYSMAVDIPAFIEYAKNVNDYGMSPSAE